MKCKNCKCKNCKWFQPFMFVTIIEDWKEAVWKADEHGPPLEYIRGGGSHQYMGLCEEENSDWYKAVLSEEHESCAHIKLK